MSEEQLVARRGNSGSDTLLALHRSEQMEKRPRLKRHDVRGHADIALPAAGGPLMEMRSRPRRHRDAQHGGDRDDQDRRAERNGHAMNRDHCCGGFFLVSAGLSSAGGSSVSNRIVVSAAYFWYSLNSISFLLPIRPSRITTSELAGSRNF